MVKQGQCVDIAIRRIAKDADTRDVKQKLWCDSSAQIDQKREESAKKERAMHSAIILVRADEKEKCVAALRKGTTKLEQFTKLPRTRTHR